MSSRQTKSSSIKIVLLLIVVGLFSGCEPKPKEPIKTTPFVVIRGSELRSDIFPLPLEKDAIQQLLSYIKKGCDTKGVGPVDFYDAKFYTGLLNLLSVDRNNDGRFELYDLFDDVKGERILKTETAKYFIKPILYSIFDSRLKRPVKKSCRPFALSDKRGNINVVFYRQGCLPETCCSQNKIDQPPSDPAHITSVMITVPIERELEHYK